MQLREIARLVNGAVSISDDIEILNAAKIEEAGPGDITFISNLKYKKYLSTTSASALLIANNIQFEELEHRKTPIAIVRVSDPYQSFLQVIDLFYPPPQRLPTGIHPAAIIDVSAKIGPNAAIGAYVIIGERCTIGSGTAIYHGTVLSEGVQVGDESIIYSNVSIRENCKIGDRVIIHSGTAIGSDGFGFTPKEDGSHEKIPQRGIVVIEDDVEIGANCTIDRATIGETRIKRGTKLDNLIHIAHNVIIGEHTVMAAQTGISGSTKVGKYCAFGGQVGLTGHITIADKTTIGAQSGVPKSIEESGKTYFGYPAKELHETLKIQAAQNQLPTLLYEIRNMQKRIEELEKLLKLRSSD
jgi:UDP-3-O-[3-hydroxymyristoyl] glucosamine N-acyltransferase